MPLSTDPEGCDSDASRGRAELVLHDVAEMWRFARHAGFDGELRRLHRPRLAVSLRAAALDWLLIAAAAVCVSSLGWIAVPLALLVIGNRQRALGNLLHDASHWSMDRDRRRAARLANLLFCWPLWVSMATYRDEHRKHHRYLGDPARDPDFIHDERRLGGGWLRLWAGEIFSGSMLRNAAFGNLERCDRPTRLGSTLWWGAALGLVSLVASPADAAIFLALWIGAKVTVFHAITALREISDHVGLHPGTLIGFSRNHPFGGLLGQLFHPHRNGYHLLHHLVPRVPFHAIPRAHALLLAWPPYAAGTHCRSYFAGPSSAVRSWVRAVA